MCKKLTSLLLTFMILFSLASVSAKAEEVKPAMDFAVEIGDITAEKGATEVCVPIHITKMFDDKNVGCFKLNVAYDADLLSWNEGDYTPGSCIENPALDLMVGKYDGDGIVNIEFATDSKPITPAGVAIDDLYVTLKFTVKDTTKDFATEFGLTAASRVVTSDGYYTKEEFAKCVKGNTLTYKAGFPFEIKVSDVAVPLGTTKVEVPIKFTKMFPNTNIESIQINVIYDAEKLGWTENGGYKTGSMIPVPWADVIVAEPYGPGSILVSFVTDVNPITPAAVAADNTFVTLTFTVKDASASFAAPILMTPAYAGGVNHNDWIPKKELANVFKAGSVTVGTAPAVNYGNIDDDEDKSIDASDLQFLKLHLKGKKPIKNHLRLAADLDGDGFVDASDLQELKLYISKKRPFSVHNK